VFKLLDNGNWFNYLSSFCPNPAISDQRLDVLEQSYLHGLWSSTPYLKIFTECPV
jgi:hypothetical protein